MKSNAVRDRLIAAGFTYPTNWEEMGSSEKDLWEDKIIASLDRKNGDR